MNGASAGGSHTLPLSLWFSLCLPPSGPSHGAYPGPKQEGSPETVDSGFDGALLSVSCSLKPAGWRRRGGEDKVWLYLPFVQKGERHGEKGNHKGGLHLQCCDVSPLLPLRTSPVISSNPEVPNPEKKKNLGPPLKPDSKATLKQLSSLSQLMSLFNVCNVKLPDPSAPPFWRSLNRLSRYKKDFSKCGETRQKVNRVKYLLICQLLGRSQWFINSPPPHTRRFRTRRTPRLSA